MTSLTETSKEVEASEGKSREHLGFEEAEKWRLLRLQGDYTALAGEGNFFKRTWYSIKETRLKNSEAYARYVLEPAARENAARLSHSHQVA